MDIGIVTSFYNHYDRFLPQWAQSIAELKTKPTTTTIVVSGPDFDPENIKKAQSILSDAAISNSVYYLEKHIGMGHARNESVRNTQTEWIMYLDVDDIILPDAIDEYSKYQDIADVISGGLLIKGAKKNQRVIFDATTERALRGEWVSCSHGVYRKKFWERSPYITINDYVDQVLWLGFAQIGARFAATSEICTVYLSRTDGHNLSMTPAQKQEQREMWKDFVKNGVYKKNSLLHPITDAINMFYYTAETNFGDLLGPIIVEWISGKKVNLVPKAATNKLLSVGSIVGAVKPKDVIWGSGIISNDLVKIPKGVKVLAVRGPMTKRLMKDVDVPDVFGDPALLMPRIYNPQIEKQYEIGYIPHYVDAANCEIKDDRILFIDVTNPNPFETIDKILSCKVIVSTSLHGIIVAEAYGIPVVWLQVSRKIVGNNFKFKDYFVSTGRPMNTNPIILEQLIIDQNLFDMKDKVLPPPIIDVEPLIQAWRNFENGKDK